MNKIVSLTISGPDQIGLSEKLFSALQEVDIRILDISQSVIHNHILLGIVIQLPDDKNSSLLLPALQNKGESLGINIRVSPLSETDYQQLTKKQSQRNYIITLLTRKFSAKEITQVTQVITEQGLNICAVTRLSKHVSFDKTVHNDNTPSCTELSVTGNPQNIEEMRERFLEISIKLGIDVVIQEDDAFRKTRRLVCFDMDSTLIKAEVIDELAKHAGVGEAVAVITERAMQGEIDFRESFKQRMALLAGLDVSILENIANNLPIMDGAERLIKNLNAYGFKTAILSGGFTDFGHYLQKKLGIDYVHANTLEHESGKLTGKIVEPIIDGAMKAKLLKNIAKQQGITQAQTVAVGDGANDLPMLSAAGLGIAFRAKTLVREQAKQALSTQSLDSILYLLGFKDSDIQK